jgi:HPt (histidine-containing phosphotransfer) domain-containing protein
MTYTLDPNSELPPHLLQLFLRAGPLQLKLVIDACERRDDEGARFAAHKLKGGLYAVGASTLAQSVEALRGTLAKGDWLLVKRQLQAIRDDFAGLSMELERQLKASQP